jgi:hypothetical protein
MRNLAWSSGEAPGHQAALDIYKGAWTTAMPPGSGLRAGDNDLFSDVRVAWAAARLGGLADKSILELASKAS